MKNKMVLQVTNLSIVFGGLRAVNNFSLELYKNELVGLIGPNGAGKTTVFNMLTGIYAPTEGDINYWDSESRIHLIGKKQPAVLNKIGIARTFQNIRLFNALSVMDNVKIALHAHRKANIIDVLLRTPKFQSDENLIEEKAMQLLSLFKIENKKDELAKNLPYGEQRKLEIVRALAAKPQILFLDEPAAGMNPQETEELMQLIAFIRKEFDLTILLIEHDMKLVMGICERLIVLDYGKIIASGLPEKIRKDPQVIKAYLGEEALDYVESE